DDFEGGYGNWTMDGLWNAEAEGDACGSLVSPFPSSSNAAYFGVDGGQCTYDNGSTAVGSLTMNSPVVLPAATELTFYSYEETECGGDCTYDNRYVEISTDGGSSWAGLGEGNTEGSWYARSFDLTPYGGSSAQIRFRFNSGDSFWNDYFGWMVDNVSISELICIPPTDGGLVVGNVYDDNTLAALNGAMVDNEDGFMAETVETPLDPAVDDAFYTLFSPSGSKVHTATLAAPYGPDIIGVTVVQSDTVGQDFYLGAPS
ncbi:MAG: hypothetical protein GY792_20325, partial [Gammaproteobacteria bacterium]|nr:hypothetical protein [Gammaproteobacteria bacterium]